MSGAHLSSMWEQVSKTAHIAWKKQNHVGPSNLKWTNCLRVWNKSSLTKMRFWKAVPIQEYCPLWGQRTRTTLLSLVRARLPTYRSQGSSFLDLLYTFVVVVHSYLQSRLIKHEWDASFFDVGASLKNCSRRLQRTKPCKSFGPKADKLLAGFGTNPPP